MHIAGIPLFKFGNSPFFNFRGPPSVQHQRYPPVNGGILSIKSQQCPYPVNSPPLHAGVTRPPHTDGTPSGAQQRYLLRPASVVPPTSKVFSGFGIEQRVMVLNIFNCKSCNKHTHHSAWISQRTWPPGSSATSNPPPYPREQCRQQPHPPGAAIAVPLCWAALAGHPHPGCSICIRIPQQRWPYPSPEQRWQYPPPGEALPGTTSPELCSQQAPSPGQCR